MVHVVSSLYRYSKMEHFSYKGEYGVTCIEGFKEELDWAIYIHIIIILHGFSY